MGSPITPSVEKVGFIKTVINKMATIGHRCDWYHLNHYGKGVHLKVIPGVGKFRKYYFLPFFFSKSVHLGIFFKKRPKKGVKIFFFQKTNFIFQNDLLF